MELCGGRKISTIKRYQSENVPDLLSDGDLCNSLLNK